jgi:hypothetical protein
LRPPWKDYAEAERMESLYLLDEIRAATAPEI